MTGIEVKVNTKACPHCGVASTLTVDSNALAAWWGGALIQDAFPEMSIDDRELLITGFHPDCWLAAMGPEEE